DDIVLAHAHGVGPVDGAGTFANRHDQHQLTGAGAKIDVGLGGGVGIFANEVFAQHRTPDVGDVHFERLTLGGQRIHLHDGAVGDHGIPAGLLQQRLGIGGVVALGLAAFLVAQIGPGDPSGPLTAAADDGGAGGGGSAQAVNVPAQAELIGQRLAAELAQEDRVVDEVAAGIQIGLGVVQHLDVGDLP